MSRRFICLIFILAQALSANSPALVDPCPDALSRPVEGPDTPPRVVIQLQPYFPQRARDLNIRIASVNLQFTVPAEGPICGIRILNPGTQGFDEKALDAIRLWTFAPALKLGRPVTTLHRAEVKFSVYEPKSSRIYAIVQEAQFNGLTPKLVHGTEAERKHAMKRLKEMSDQAYAPADALYGMALLEAKGVAQNFELGLKRIARARGKQAPLGDFALGHALEFGYGIPADKAAAFQYYRLAAKARISPVPAAQLRLANDHLSGDTVPQDRTEAIRLFRLCAASAVKACAFNLALALADPAANETDRTEALAWALILEDSQYPRTAELLKDLDGPLRQAATKLKPQLMPQRYKP